MTNILAIIVEFCAGHWRLDYTSFPQTSFSWQNKAVSRRGMNATHTRLFNICNLSFLMNKTNTHYWEIWSFVTRNGVHCKNTNCYRCKCPSARPTSRNLDEPQLPTVWTYNTSFHCSEMISFCYKTWALVKKKKNQALPQARAASLLEAKSAAATRMRWGGGPREKGLAACRKENDCTGQWRVCVTCPPTLHYRASALESPPHSLCHLKLIPFPAPPCHPSTVSPSPPSRPPDPSTLYQLLLCLVGPVHMATCWTSSLPPCRPMGNTLENTGQLFL